LKIINLGKSALLKGNSSINLWIVLILSIRKEILLNAFEQIAIYYIKTQHFLLSNAMRSPQPLFIDLK
jgi:hypothetical protein